jgi:hypothetical protein
MVVTGTSEMPEGVKCCARMSHGTTVECQKVSGARTYDLLVVTGTAFVTVTTF